MGVISEEHFSAKHQEGADDLTSKINNTQAAYVTLNAMMNGLDHFDRYSSFSNLMCRFVLMGTHSTNGITLSAVQGGAWVWLSVGLVGMTFAVIGSVVDHDNRKKGLEKTLKECAAVLAEIEEYQRTHSVDPLSNVALLEKILRNGGSLESRKIRRMLAAVLGKSPYEIDFNVLKTEIAKAAEAEALTGTPNAPVLNFEQAKKRKVSVKQVISYIANFLSCFGTGAGFVYWGAFMFGAAVPFGWALILVGVLVGVLVGLIFMLQQILMENMHTPLDQRASDFLENLKLNKKLQKLKNKISNPEYNKTYEDFAEKLSFSSQYLADETKDLYDEKIPAGRKHAYRAGMIGYNAVLGFVIGFALVGTFAFVTGGVALIPSIVVGLAFGGYFIYSGADRCNTAEKEEEAKRAELRAANIDYRTHWETHQSRNYNPEGELYKTVPHLVLDMVRAFNAQYIRNAADTKYRNQKKVLALIASTANVPLLRTNDIVSPDFFDSLYRYLLQELKEEIANRPVLKEQVHNAVSAFRAKILGHHYADIRMNEPDFPKTTGQRIRNWFKTTFTREKFPKGVKRAFAIAGILTLGAAIPFMAMSGGIVLPVMLGVFMVAVLIAYILREGMEYKGSQDLESMDKELNKYELIERTRKLKKPGKDAELANGAEAKSSSEESDGEFVYEYDKKKGQERMRFQYKERVAEGFVQHDEVYGY